MANGDRWRNDPEWTRNQDWRSDQERYGSRTEERPRNDDRNRWREFGRGSESGGDYRESRGDWSGGGREGQPGGEYGAESHGAIYRGGRDYGGRGNEGFGGRGQGYGQRDERGLWDRASDEVSSWFGDDDAERRRRMDDMRGGGYRGRGPKGYTRSDERIREDVSDRLSDDPMVDASEIEVVVTGCEVTLSGTVDNREAKRRAEDLAERVTGVKNVQNNLRIQQPASGMSSTGAGSAIGTPEATMTSGQGTSSGSRKAGTTA